MAANIFANRETTRARAARRAPDGGGDEARPRRWASISIPHEGRSSLRRRRQLVEIARTLEQQSEIIIMDEPNSALSAAETERLFALLRRLRDKGLTIIYVSHRLEEVFAIADRISVIRDGRYQGTWALPKRRFRM